MISGAFKILKSIWTGEQEQRRTGEKEEWKNGRMEDRITGSTG